MFRVSCVLKKTSNFLIEVIFVFKILIFPVKKAIVRD